MISWFFVAKGGFVSCIRIAPWWWIRCGVSCLLERHCSPWETSGQDGAPEEAEQNREASGALFFEKAYKAEAVIWLGDRKKARGGLFASCPSRRGSGLQHFQCSDFGGVNMEKRCLLVLGLLCCAFSGGIASANTITIDVSAYIDGRDQLIIKDDTLQWHHLDYAAVGRHGGHDYPTTVSTYLDGVVQMNDFDWTPVWNESGEIRHEAYSEIFDGLTPSLPSGPMTVSLTPLQSRNATTIWQYPDSTNDFTLIVEFNDNQSGGAAWYESSLTIETAAAPVPEPATMLLFGTGLSALAGLGIRRRKNRA